MNKKLLPKKDNTSKENYKSKFKMAIKKSATRDCACGGRQGCVH